MSPLYTVFSVDDTIDKLYLEHYFKTSRWHQFMFLEGNSGARSDRFSISDSIFFEMPIQCPVLEEQELIASFFGRLDSLITLHQRKYCGVVSWMLGVALVRLGSESDGAFGEMKHVLR
jgi:type I restriction enzyme S subunit